MKTGAISISEELLCKPSNENEKTDYENLSIRNVTDNQTFRKTVKPYFSKKRSNSRRITLLEND